MSQVIGQIKYWEEIEDENLKSTINKIKNRWLNKREYKSAMECLYSIFHCKQFLTKCEEIYKTINERTSSQEYNV